MFVTVESFKVTGFLLICHQCFYFETVHCWNSFVTLDSFDKLCIVIYLLLFKE